MMQNDAEWFQSAVMVLLDIVHRGDSSLRIVLVRIANESKATAATGITILDHDLEAGRSHISKGEALCNVRSRP